jgi:hypothetical protein
VNGGRTSDQWRVQLRISDLAQRPLLEERIDARFSGSGRTLITYTQTEDAARDLEAVIEHAAASADVAVEHVEVSQWLEEDRRWSDEPAPAPAEESPPATTDHPADARRSWLGSVIDALRGGR